MIEQLERRTLLTASVGVSYEFLSLGGTQLTSLVAGQDFILQASIQDVQSTPTGIYQAYLTVSFNSSLVSIPAGTTITEGAAYDGPTVLASLSPGSISAGGEKTSTKQPNPLNSEFTLFQVELQAQSTTGQFTLNTAVAAAPNYTVLFNNPIDVTTADLDVTGNSITIVASSQTTPTVVATDAGGPYTGSPYAATATVNGASSLEGVSPTFTYYVGSTVSGSGTATAPSAVGTYTVVASFAGSTDYISANSSPVTFSITKATPTVTATDAGGPYTGTPYAATATVNGTSSLEGVSPTFTYYVGSTVSGSGTATAPSAAGTYTVVASFAGSTDYNSAASSPLTYSITKATPTVTATDAGGPYTSSPYAATATVNGGSSLEGVSPTFTYYVGSTASGNGTATAPSAAGTYTVVASFAGSTDYNSANSSPVTFSITKLTPIVTTTDAGGPYTGSPYAATATVNGTSSLEGVSPTFTYYVGSTASGSSTATAPSTAGTYTVVASFAGSTDYNSAASSPVTYSITKATPIVTATDAGGPYTGSPYAATATVNGASSLEGVSPTFAYYVGSTASGSSTATAPSATGTYTVVASFAGSTDYNSANSSPVTFSIAKATPTVTATDAGGPFTGSPYAATATVNGAGSLEGVSPTFTYYVGSTPSGSGTATAPERGGHVYGGGLLRREHGLQLRQQQSRDLFHHHHQDHAHRHGDRRRRALHGFALHSHGHSQRRQQPGGRQPDLYLLRRQHGQRQRHGDRAERGRHVYGGGLLRREHGLQFRQQQSRDLQHRQGHAHRHGDGCRRAIHGLSLHSHGHGQRRRQPGGRQPDVHLLRRQHRQRQRHGDRAAARWARIRWWPLSPGARTTMPPTAVP